MVRTISTHVKSSECRVGLGILEERVHWEEPESVGSLILR
jgi:hypothetical protein